MTVVAVIGGGVYAPVLCEGLARALPGASVRVRLSARDLPRLGVIAGESALRVRALHPRSTVTAARSFEEAVEGAEHVVLLVRVGGLAARAWDEDLALARAMVGDEGLGVGGVSNAWRTLPPLTVMARALRERAPRATVWNLIAPLGITTRCLLDEGVDALGVCELPLVTRERWGLSEGDLGYAGLNHLGWFWPRTDAARAALEAAPDVDAPTLRAFGAAPLRYFYELFAPEAAERIGVTRTPGRARALTAMSDEALSAFQRAPGAWRPARATPWFDRALVPMLAAREGGAAWTGYVNVRNGRDAWAFAEPDAVVEAPATIDVAGVHARRDLAMPGAVERWLTGAARSEALAYRAARARDAEALRAALAALPVAPSREDVEWFAARIERGAEGEVS